MDLNKDQRESVQRKLNHFTTKHLKGFQPLIVDGKFGPATEKRISEVKYFVGNNPPNGSDITKSFLKRVERARDVDAYPNRDVFRRARRRRRRQRNRWRLLKGYALIRPGVINFEGKPVAKWFLPHLLFAREHGWRGGVNSGWRDPAYSESLCYRMCGAPSCPGRCAGRSSNHSGTYAPAGAIDVSDYVTFGRLMARSDAPSPRIYNALGAQDPVHFSVSGR